MERKHVDEKNMTVDTENASRRRDSLLPIANGVTIVVTRAFGPAGDNLVGISDERFDDYPAVTLRVRANGRDGLVHLSPIHGDRRKRGFTDIPAGTRCELLCPVSGRPLDRVGPVDDGSGAEYYALYLTPALSQEAMVAVSDVWDHFHSRVVDDNELLSYWAATHDSA